jgi:hypothetical protein
MEESGRRMPTLGDASSQPCTWRRPACPGADPGAPDRGDFPGPTRFLSAKAFSAILPLFIVVTTISPDPGLTCTGPFLGRNLGLAAEDVLIRARRR